VSDGGVHSSIEHLLGLCDIMQANDLQGFAVHAFTDGRDTDPRGGTGYLSRLMEHLHKTGGQLASVTGRYYAMDRDKRWERIRLAYDALVHGKGEPSQDIIASIEQRYAANETDEFLHPLIMQKDGEPVALIKEGDVVINFNFRTDRGREITQALTQMDFPAENMHKLPLKYITLTEYDKTYKGVEVVFPDLDLSMTLGEVLEKAGKKQVRIAETEKYPHVTFFFSGGREVMFEGERQHMCPSPKVATYDLQPEMSAEDVKLAVLEEVGLNQADFMCVNFANADMVGHTGVLEAEVRAVEKVDACVGEIVEAALAKKYSLLITADHGNGEYMINEEDGTPNTAHTTNNVPLLLVEPGTKHRLREGRLADLAPTILTLMDLPVPPEMNGTCLLL
jgi:2,3-bisphosphoglycerate-independent phosphoglycerate mutase